MKYLITLLFTASILSACNSNVNTMPDITQLPQDNAGALAAPQKNGLFWDSFKIRMDFVDTTIDGRPFYTCLPAIVIGNGLKQGLFNSLVLKTPTQEIGGYIVAAKDGGVFLEEYLPNKGNSKFSMNDTIVGYPVGTWDTNAKLNPAKLERIGFKKIKNFDYESELHLNPMADQNLTIIAKAPLKPVTLKRSDLLLLPR